MKTQALFLAYFLGIWSLTSCDSQETIRLNQEIYNGDLLISQARHALNDHDFDKAIRLIDSIRTTYPRAMNAREDGILLKDTIEMARAQCELKELESQGITSGEQWEEIHRRLKYFARKLQHDQEQRKNHTY